MDLEEGVRKLIPAPEHVELSLIDFVWEKGKFGPSVQDEARRLVDLWTSREGVMWVLGRLGRLDLRKIFNIC